jgi:signal transduction histidine kinase
LLEDLTSVQTLEDELAHSERLASIGRLAAGVAHEIGNPVTGIACITQNLRYETEPDMLEEGLNEILQQTTRITDIVQSLVTFSHGGAPEDDRVRTFNLAECINDAHRLVRLSRDAKQLDYAIECDQALQVDGDRQRILQVVVNLLSNACDASEPGGRIEVESCRAKHLAVIRVRDQGPGIPADLRERVLEPFYTTKEPGEGTGLGLPLAYSIVHDHGGSLRIENRPEGGCTVTVRLPLHRTSETVARAS